MSVKKEPSGRRSVQVEVEVPGTPEEVWRAISTGPGISSWFVPTEMEQHAGGKIKIHFGPGMDAESTITEWQPPVRFAAESRWDHLGENAPAVATEWFVEARSGGVCIVRVVHSLFAETSDWDGELEGTESGWPIYFSVLRLFLERFPGMTGTSMIAMGFSGGTVSEMWDKVIKRLGLEKIDTGQSCRTAADAPRLSGIAESIRAQQREPSLILCVNEPAPGIAVFAVSPCAGNVLLSVYLYIYGEHATDLVAKEQPQWQSWIDQNFPPPAPPAQ